MLIIHQSQSFFLFNLRVRHLYIACTGSRLQPEVTLIIKLMHHFGGKGHYMYKKKFHTACLSSLVREVENGEC